MRNTQRRAVRARRNMELIATERSGQQAALGLHRCAALRCIAAMRCVSARSAQQQPSRTPPRVIYINSRTVSLAGIGERGPGTGVRGAVNLWQWVPPSKGSAWICRDVVTWSRGHRAAGLGARAGLQWAAWVHCEKKYRKFTTIHWKI